MKGLEATILPVKQVLSSTDKLRLDSNYHSKWGLEAEGTIGGLPHLTFAEISSVFRKGIFDIKAESYVKGDEGVPFLRIGDLKKGLIQKDATARISNSAHLRENKTKLSFGDLVLSKTAYPAASMVNIEDCNISQDIIAVKLNALGLRSFKPGFLAAFLNTRYGKALMARRFQGNVQQHLSLPDGKTIRIPLLETNFQERVHEVVCTATSLQDESTSEESKAQNALLQGLGLENWKPRRAASRISRSRDVLAAGRLDAEFFSNEFDELMDRLVSSRIPMKKIRDIRSHNGRGLQPEYDPKGGVLVVNSRHILEGRIDYEGLERTSQEWFRLNERAHLKPGDILTYTTGANIGRTALFSLTTPSIGSNHVNILRLTEGTPAYVAFTMNSIVGRLQTKRNLSGTAQAELYPSHIDDFVIPFISNDLQIQITEKLSNSEELRSRAEKYLSDAVRAVEIYIEVEKSAAIAFLEETRRPS